MKPLALIIGPLCICSSSSSRFHSSALPKPLLHNLSFRVSCSSLQPNPVIYLSILVTSAQKPVSRFSFTRHKQKFQVNVRDTSPKPDYEPGFIDDVFLNLFRNKMVQEVGWDSEKPGYDGLIEVAHRLMSTGRTNAETREAAVRILRSLFPPLLLDLYKLLISPLGNGKVAAIMVARVTAITCQWLMGRCTVNSVDLPDGTSCQSGIFVERCKYLEESKCVGICVNTCKLPTQTFFKDCMGVPLLMEPNFTDYSCQFKFGIVAPQPEDDSSLKEPCLEVCPIASRRRVEYVVVQCPKA